MADTRPELEAALSAAITDDVDEADRLDVLEGAYRVLGDAMDSTWTAWARFDQQWCASVCDRGSRRRWASASVSPLARCRVTR